MAWVNLNDHVRFKPSEKGLEGYDDHRVALGLTPKPLAVDDDGFAKMPLWEFMEIFGPHMHLGSEMPVTVGWLEVLETRG